ncbi:AMP-binding protein [Psychrobacter sp. I-STPA10]|uniref:AMP-binding protein n=1 Tax=Psychrobacter sp. I-STPA10 TaxID=2585769 RepID=UPI001E61B6E9|nr:AMP-binding protein [Psychrobacter sp. I-STPA10]
MDKVWTACYPDSVPETIYTETYHNVTELFNASFARYRNLPLTTCMGVTHTYADIEKIAANISSWLQYKQIPAGSVIALMMPNVPQYLPIMVAILQAGYICTPVNPLYTGRELKHQLIDSKAETIFLIDNFAQALEQVVDETYLKNIVVSKMGDLMGLKGFLVNIFIRNVKKMVPKYNLDNPDHKVYKFTDVLKIGSQRSFYPSKAIQDDIAIYQYTGGTTGLSKGAMLSHRNLIAAALSSEAWSRPATKKITDVYVNMVMALPLYHIFAFMLALLGIRAGYTFIMIPNPRDMPGFIKTLSKQPFHFFPGVNTLFNGLLKQPDFKNLDFSRLTVTQAGGMAANEKTAREWLEVTGCPMIEGWGMTEGVAVGTANIVTDTNYNGTIGLPLPSVDVTIRDENDNPVGYGEAGELCIKGPNVTSGYLNHDNVDVFTHDGYFKSGDIVSMDERGYITLLDRKKDMVLVSGFNVFPNEVEAVMSECPGIVDCALIGVPDERQGESLKLFIIREDDTVSESSIREFALENLTGYKCPRYIEFIDELPKSNVGKVLRQKLREHHHANEANINK